MPEPATTEERVKIGLYVRRSLYRRAKAHAAQTDQPTYIVVERALEAYLEDNIEKDRRD